jgi:glycosyltransferase involved in cell wall biosynthesis
MQPEVSVLMSVYNSERWLAESIESVLNQTFTDFEFLIVNDGSTDDSRAIINRYAEQDSRIRIFDKPNTGLADSLNYGIAHAKGKWVARIDADDLCISNRLKKQMKVAQSTEHIVLIGTGLTLIDDKSTPLKTYRYPQQHQALLKSLISGGKSFAHSSALYRTNSVRDVGGYRARVLRAEDHDLWLRLSEVGHLFCVEAPLVQIRKHSDQISHDENGERQLVDSHVAMVSYWLRRAGLVDPVNASSEEFEAFYHWVRERLFLKSVFLDSTLLRELKGSLQKSGRFLKPLVLFRFVFSHPLFVSRWLAMHIIGSNMSKKLAAEWRVKSYE